MIVVVVVVVVAQEIRVGIAIAITYFFCESITLKYSSNRYMHIYEREGYVTIYAHPNIFYCIKSV